MFVCTYGYTKDVEACESLQHHYDSEVIEIKIDNIFMQM